MLVLLSYIHVLCVFENTCSYTCNTCIIDKTFNGGAICLNNGTCTLMRGPQSVLLNELI